MRANREIDAVFFDIAGTLGQCDPNTGKLVPYGSSPRLLQIMRDVVGLRVGVITTLGPRLTNIDGVTMLREAGLVEFIDRAGFVSDHDAGVGKPHPAIYLAAARRFDLPPSRCLFVGENLADVVGAIAVGMKAVLKPSPRGSNVSA